MQNLINSIFLKLNKDSGMKNDRSIFDDDDDIFNAGATYTKGNDRSEKKEGSQEYLKKSDSDPNMDANSANSEDEGVQKPLINKDKEVEVSNNIILLNCQPKLPRCYGLKKFFGLVISREKRTLYMNGRTIPRRYPANKIRNQKYNLITFVPVVLFNQFKFFFNLFFLLICLSQFIPALKVGFLFTYIAPLAFVLVVTLLKEAWDDLQRYSRDKELNNKKHEKLTIQGIFENVSSANMRVGDIIKVNKNERIPADMILLYTTEKGGSVFIRTDQLDGETDWKLRKPISFTQKVHDFHDIINIDGHVVANPPTNQIYDFKGYYQSGDDPENQQREGLSLENTLWTNTVLASTGFILGLVTYTGKETRSAMNQREPSTKVGKLDMEVNRLSKFLFFFMICISLGIVALDEFKGFWIIKFFRFVLILSYIIPISLRVNLDMAKIYYSYCILKDKEIDGTLPRNSTIPEELGRIQFLLTDKTGTLTKNDMIFKKVAMEYAQFDYQQ